MSDAKPLILINVSMNQPNAMAQLQFTDAARAEGIKGELFLAIQQASDAQLDLFDVTDDHGISLAGRGRDILCVCLIDKQKELNGAAELAILQGHANVRLQKRAAADPELRQAQLMQPANGAGGIFPPRMQ